MVDLMVYLPMDGFVMKSLFTVGALLPCVGIAILLKQIVTKNNRSLFLSLSGSLAKSLGELSSKWCCVINFFAVIYYELEVINLPVRQQLSVIWRFDERRIFRMSRKKISRKTLTKSFHHWFYDLTCFSQEHMQTFGYLTSMLPIVKKCILRKSKRSYANIHSIL